MKKLFYSLFAITMAVFSFTSCEDVPAHPSSRLPKGNKEFYVLAIRPGSPIIFNSWGKQSMPMYL